MRDVPLSPRATLRAVATLTLAVLALGTAVPGSRAQSLDVKEVVLENGLRLLLVPKPGDPNVAAGWIARVGSVNERPGITGLSHLFEHMMFKGTHVVGTRDIDQDLAIIAELDRVRAELAAEQGALDARARQGEIADANDPTLRSPRHQELRAEFDALLARQKALLIDNEFDQIYQNQGGSGMNAGTSSDFTIYFINVPANKLELWFWMESDRLGSPVFRQFYSERDVVWEERRMRTDSTPTGRLDEQFDAMFWMASPYSWPVIGWPSDLDGITRDEALDYFRRNYAPGNLTAALVGDFDVADAERLAKTYFGRLPPSAQPPTAVRTFEPEPLAPKRLEGEADTRPTVKVRWPGVPTGHVDEPALSVLADLLNGQTGRFERSLVQDQQVATTARASFDARKYGGYLELTGVAAPDRDVAELERALHAEIQRFAKEPVPARELQKVKNQTLADDYRRLGSNFFILMQLLIYDANRDWRDMMTEADRILAVTPDDIQRVARKYFDPTKTCTAVYRTKKTEAAEGPADPLWAALTPEQQTMAAPVKARLDAANADELRQALEGLGGAAEQAPAAMRPVLDWAVGYAQARLARLEGGET
jgi:predicted Zn-dependent peptidase